MKLKLYDEKRKHLIRFIMLQSLLSDDKFVAMATLSKFNFNGNFISVRKKKLKVTQRFCT